MKLFSASFYNVLRETFPFFRIYSLHQTATVSQAHKSFVLFLPCVNAAGDKVTFCQGLILPPAAKGVFCFVFSDVVVNALVNCRLLCRLVAVVLLVPAVLSELKADVMEQVKSGFLLSMVRKAESPLVSVCPTFRHIQTVIIMSETTH